MLIEVFRWGCCRGNIIVAKGNRCCTLPACCLDEDTNVSGRTVLVWEIAPPGTQLVCDRSRGRGFFRVQSSALAQYCMFFTSNLCLGGPSGESVLGTPFLVWKDEAVWAHLSGLPSISAPCWSRTSAHSTNPIFAATCRGVRRSTGSGKLVDAPASQRARAACALLFSMATRSGVLRALSSMSTPATEAMSSLQTST